MVDATQATESTFVTADLIEKSPTKKLVIMHGAKYEEGNFGTRLQLKVSLDAKGKKWSPNRETAEYMLNAWGKDTDTWVGKVVMCTTKEQNGKTSILGTPLQPNPPTETIQDVQQQPIAPVQPEAPQNTQQAPIQPVQPNAAVESNNMGGEKK